MQPSAVADGATALVELESAYQSGQPFEFVLLDADMPYMDGFKLAERIKSNDHFDSVTLMMLSSAALPSDVERCRQFGISTYMTKPIKRSELIEGLTRAIRRSLPNQSADLLHETPDSTKIEVMSGRKLRILLAEDNPVNQRVVMGILRKRGHEIVVANHGKEALQAAQARLFDIILMDVQMPVMDGLEATALIRQHEQLTGRHTPIVALTARAMTGDQETCLQAGMDTYIAKPIDTRKLLKTIQELVSAAEQSDGEGGERSHLEVASDVTPVQTIMTPMETPPVLAPT
jgi:CheY-like chemotaxis protein